MTVELANGVATVIDSTDARLVAGLKWHLVAKRYVGTKIKGREVYLHRFLMNATPGLEVDHINGDTLDNRRANLRVVTHRTNIANRTRLNRNNTSGVTGVSWDRSVGKWMAHITINRRRKTLGVYLRKEDAIEARRLAEVELA
jgi:hypothetical protein